MNAIRVVSRIDEQHRLTADVPAAVPTGQVEPVEELKSDEDGDSLELA